jgi:hypothetical protein
MRRTVSQAAHEVSGTSVATCCVLEENIGSDYKLTAMLPVISFCTTTKAGLPKSPKILTRFSLASQNEAVSTPSSVTGTST